jgi:hypothetical protein
VKFNDCPSANPPRFGVSVTLTGPEGVTVMVAAAVLETSLTDVAVKVTAGGAGRLTGAVYVTAAPDALDAGATVPHVAPLQPAPDSVQLTPAFAESFVTVAVKLAVPPAATVAVVCDKLTAIGAGGAGATVIAAAAVFVASDTDLAVSVTLAGVGALAGALYVIAVPEALLAAESVPHAAPLQPAPDKAQVTPAFELSFATVAVNAWPRPTCTDELAGETVTEIGGGVDTGSDGWWLAPEPPQPHTSAITQIPHRYRNPGARCAHVCVTVGLPVPSVQIVRGKGPSRLETCPEDCRSCRSRAILIEGVPMP